MDSLEFPISLRNIASFVSTKEKKMIISFCKMKMEERKGERKNTDAERFVCVYCFEYCLPIIHSTVSMLFTYCFGYAFGHSRLL